MLSLLTGLSLHTWLIIGGCDKNRLEVARHAL